MSELLDVALQAHGSNAGVKPKFRGTNDVAPSSSRGTEA
jgi:hypothetical protein